MPRFEYTARDRSGSRVTGAVEAGSVDAVAGQLFDQGITPIDIQQRARSRGPGLRRRLGMDQPSRDDIVMFSRQMYTLTRSGVPLIRGLTQLAESTRNPVLRETIRTVMADLESGRELSGSLARHPRVFSPLYVAMIRVGEDSGRLEESFERLTRYLERERDTVRQIKQAVRYPTIVVAAIAIAIFILMTYVIPVFADVFERFDAQLPLMTRVLIAVSNFFAAYWWAILIAIGGAWYGLKLWRRTENGALRWDRGKLKTPIIGDILLRATLARFARAFSMSQRSGVPILQAMNVTAAAVDNVWISRKVLGMREGIERGESLSRTAQRTEVFTPLVIQMISVGEESGRLDEMIDEVADFYEREVDYDVQNLGSLVEPILTIGVAILVFLLALGIFLPMWDLGAVQLGG
ncbi:type II secretion system F family protein [Halofilum ochraceum]|uniref:type II secretion system F family protein n=1 Tax=Halofilum ochraceum TaxID=1611323 RepID=UPI0008DA2090|nr:type II secretion system F family protein [Halofilum ochraceum]